MLSSLNQWLPQTYNQTDRIQGMARYMNREGSNSEGMTLLLIFAGMLAVILVLRTLAARNRKKQRAALEKRMAKKKP